MWCATCIFSCVAVCCSVLQCVAVCCSVLQCVAVCCGALLRTLYNVTHLYLCGAMWCATCNFPCLCQLSALSLERATSSRWECVCAKTIITIPVTMQTIDICCSVLQCVAVCCSVLRTPYNITHLYLCGAMWCAILYFF